MNNKYLSKRTRIKGENNPFILIIKFITCILLIAVLFDGLNKKYVPNSNIEPEYSIENIIKKNINNNKIIIEIDNDEMNLENIYNIIYKKLLEIIDVNIINVKDFFLAIKSYQYHYDKYLNAILRDETYNIKRLICNFVFYEKEILQWQNFKISHEKNLDEIFKNKLQKLCNSIENPFNKYKNVDLQKLNNEDKYDHFKNYLIELSKYLYIIYNNLEILKINIKQKITLYRCLKIVKDSKINEEVIGYTSFTTNYNLALNFCLTTGENKQKLYDENNNFEIIIMKVNFPVNTNFIPIDLCNLYDEDELLLCENGNLEIIKQTKKTFFDNYFQSTLSYKDKENNIKKFYPNFLKIESKNIHDHIDKNFSKLLYFFNKRQSILKKSGKEFKKNNDEYINHIYNKKYLKEYLRKDNKWILLDENIDETLLIKGLKWINNENDFIEEYILKIENEEDNEFTYKEIEYNFKKSDTKKISEDKFIIKFNNSFNSNDLNKDKYLNYVKLCFNKK